MKKKFCFVLLLAFAFVSALPAQSLIDFNFNQTPDGWNYDNGQIQDDAGNKYLHLQTGTGQVNASLGGPDLKLDNIKSLQAGLRYRTDIAGSGLHGGAWVMLMFLDASGKEIKIDGVPLKKSAKWKTVQQQIVVPSGAASLRTQIRIQGCAKSFLDIDDWKIGASAEAYVPPPPAPPVTASAIESGFETALPAEWSIQNGEIRSEPLGNRYLHLETDDQERNAGLSVHNLDLGTARSVDVSVRSRTSHPGGSMHGGTWIMQQFLDASGKEVKIDGVFLKKSDIWSETRQSVAVPSGAVKLRTQVRIQDSPNYFLDIDDLKIVPSSAESAENKPAAAVTVNELDGKIAIAEFVLVKNADGSAVLRSKDETLTNLKPGKAVYSFILPDKYCENPDYTYAIDIEFKTNWAVKPPTGFSALFAFGLNFLGQMPNSAEIDLHDTRSDTALIGRMTADNIEANVNHWIRNVNITAGQIYKVKATFSKFETTLNFQGNSGNAIAQLPFAWVKNRPFYIGGSNERLSLLDGEITAFKLSVLKPQFKAIFASVGDYGVFSGRGTHQWAVDFPDNNAKACKVELVIKGGEDYLQKFPAPQITRIEDGKIEFQIPDLPYGGYELSCKLNFPGCLLKLTRQFAIALPLPPLGKASDSPFGITQEFTLNPGKFNPQEAETLFKLSAIAGNRWYRLWTSWDQVEKEPGKRDWSVMDKIVELAQKYNLELYPVISGGSMPWQSCRKPGEPRVTHTESYYMPRDIKQWQDYLKEFVKRYQGKIRYYQIGNESDCKPSFYPFGPQYYLEFLKAGHEAIKSIDPSAKVGLAGFCWAPFFPEKPFTQGDTCFSIAAFLDLGAQPYYDIVDIHLYSLSSQNKTWDVNVPPAKALRNVLKRYGEDKKPIWNSETGFPSGAKGTISGYDTSPVISDHEQARRIVEWYVQSLAVGIERNFNYHVTTGSGLFTGSLAPKISLPAHRNLVNQLLGMKFVEELPLAAGLRGYRFAGDHQMIAAWSPAGKFPVAILTGGSPVDVVDMMGNSKKLETAGAMTLYELGKDPVFFVSAAPVRVVNFITASAVLSGQAGEVQLRVELVNPTSSVMNIKLGAAFTDKAATVRNIQLPANKQQQVLLSIPEGQGQPVLEAKVSGDITTAFSMTIPYRKRQMIVLNGSQPVKLKMNTEEQVKIGGRVIGSQNEVIAGRWKGPADLSADIQLQKQDAKLNFTVNVTDDQVVVNPQKPAYESDCIELFIAVPDEQGSVKNRFQVCMRADGELMAVGNKLPEGFAAKAVKTAAGYRIDGSFEIPADALKNGYILLDFSVDDSDDAIQGRKVQMAFGGTADNHMDHGHEKYPAVVFK